MKSLEKSLRSASSDMDSHAVKKKKESEKAKAQEQKRKAAEELAAQKRAVKARTELLLQQEKEKKSRSFAMFNLSMWQGGDRAKPVSCAASGGKSSILPWYLEDQEAAEDLNPQLQRTIATFSTKYKAYPDYVRGGRCAVILEKCGGADAVSTLHDRLMEGIDRLDLSSVAANFSRSSFLVGVSPELKWSGIQVFGGATLKKQVLGKVTHILMPLDELYQVLLSSSVEQAAGSAQAGGPSISSLSELTQFAEQMTEQAWKDAIDQGRLSAYIHTLCPGQVLFIPVGFFALEVVVDGAVVSS